MRSSLSELITTFVDTLGVAIQGVSRCSQTVLTVTVNCDSTVQSTGGHYFHVYFISLQSSFALCALLSLEIQFYNLMLLAVSDS